jgi:hypothetical protein
MRAISLNKATYKIGISLTRNKLYDIYLGYGEICNYRNRWEAI